MSHRKQSQNHRKNLADQRTRSRADRAEAERRRQNLRRSAIEQLEERRVFTCGLLEGWKDELGQQLGEFKAMIDDAVHLGQQLPVIGDHLNNVQNLLDNFDTAVPDAIEQGALDLGEEAIRQALFQVLHNSPLDMLGDTDGDGVDPQDINVQINSSGETCSLSIGAHLTRHIATLNLPIDAKFGLGLPALPFDIETSGGITAGLQLEWPDFHLTIDQSGVNLDLSSTNDVQLNITAGLEAGTELNADIGFLHAKVTDGVLLDSANGPAQFQDTELLVGVGVDFSADANGNFQVDSTITATADVALHIDAMIDQNFPSIGADFVMHWDVLGDNASEPTVDFKNVTIDFGGYLSSMLSPLVDFVKEVTEPVQPVVDVVTAPIPVLSDLAHLVGLGDVSILSLAQVADDYMESSGYKEVIEIAEIIVQVVDIVQQIDNTGETLKFDVGDISLNADNNNDGTADNGDLRNKPAAKKIDDMTAKDLTDLVTSPTSLTDIEDALMNSDLPDVVKENVGKVLAQFSSGIGYSFPILDDPLGELGKLLVGKDSSLFEFKASMDATASADLKVPVGMGIDAIIDGNYRLDAKVVLGYDTFGLRKFIVDGINNNNNFDGLDLLDGIYIDSTSHINLDGGFSAGVGVDYAVASAEVTGGVWGGLHLSKPDLSQVPPPAGLLDNDPDKIRPYSELGECLFHADGNLNAGLQGKVRLGTDLLGVDFNFDFGHAEIFSFDTDCVANPFRAPPAPKLAEFTAPGELTLNVGARGGLRNQHQNDIVENYRLTVDAPTSDEAAAGVDGDIIVVSAWGLTERFVGVKKIIGDAGLGNDKIKIIAADDPQKYPLSAKAQLNGGLGDDILIYQGTGDATMHGDAGNDQIEGGGGENWLFGDDNDDRLTGGYGTAMSFLVGGEGNDTLNGDQGPTMMGAFVYQSIGYAENGNDVLNGGQSLNILRGGAGDDKLYAGPKDDDLDGGMGNDYLEAGAGSDKLVGSRGDDTIVWNVGDGIPQLVDGGNDLETNTLALGGSDNVDWLTLSKEAGTSRLDVAGLTASPFQASFMHNIVFEGLGAADQIVVNPLTNTSVRQVGLNLADVLKYQQGVNDNAPDQITVYGAETPDSLTVETEIAIVKPAAPPQPPITLPGVPTYGGIMKVSGMPNYIVRLANVEDNLLVDSKGGGDLITVKSITGPTKIEAGDGNDQITVIASDPGTPGDPQNPADYATTLQVDGGAGVNKLVVDQTTAMIAVTTEVTSSVISSELLPGVQYESNGGTFGAGVAVKTGHFDDHVNVHDTLPNLTTSIDAGLGNDVISVSSDGAALNGDLSQIRGPLSLEGGFGSNAILLSDRAAVAGNSHVVVTSSQVIGFAGATDSATIDYKATAGQLTLGLIGSDTVGDQFQLNSPNAVMQVLGGGGADRLSVVSLTQLAAFNGGLGNDTVEVGAVVNQLDGIQANVMVYGGDGSDSLLVNDKAASSGKSYSLGGTTVQRVGTGVVQYDAATEAVTLQASDFADQVQMTGQPPTSVALTVVGNLNSGGVDTLTGANTTNAWDITGASSGKLNGNVNFVGVESLVGGSQVDTFKLIGTAAGMSKLAGGGGADVLDYSQMTTPVTVNLQTLSATQVGAFSSLELLRGGMTSDTLIGPNLPNGWLLTQLNVGSIGTMNLGQLSFDAFENLTGGTSTDVFQFSTLGAVSGAIADQGGKDRLDYSQLTNPVSVNLATGAASRTAGATGIEEVYGGSGDDLILGDGQDNTLVGNAGDDVLVGQAGNDTLDGGIGRDLLIGGNGSDTLSGGDGDDIVIGNRTSFDNDTVALKTMLTDWKQTNVSYGQRVANLKNGVGANSQYKLKAAVTVFDDLAADVLKGQGGQDWFFATLNGAPNTNDILSDQLLNEIVN